MKFSPIIDNESTFKNLCYSAQSDHGLEELVSSFRSNNGRIIMKFASIIDDGPTIKNSCYSAQSDH